MQYKSAEKSTWALELQFTMYGKEIERVEVFKYCGRLLVFDDNGTQAMRSNLMKASGVWARVSHML